MKPARNVIADVPDFWLDDKDHPMGLGEHNADRIIDALNDAGYVIAPIAVVLTAPPLPQDK